MAEVLLQFDGLIADDAGHSHTARVCGRQAEDGLWEGWIEFTPSAGGPVLRSPRETDQPNRDDLEYWATGLTTSYLEGALERARRTPLPDLRERTVAATPVYDGPATAPGARRRGTASAAVPPHTVLDPFEVYAQGSQVLRDELRALDRGHLQNIIRAHGLGGSARDLEAYDHATLVRMIIDGVEKRAD
jgi:hypothetical protein